MTAVSVDLGRARTGMAVSDRSGFLASSLCVIEEKNDEKLLQKIADRLKSAGAEVIVMGLPKNMDGSEGESAQRARKFGEELAALTGLAVEFQDERGTTITAHAYLSTSEVFGKKRKKKVDAVAASIILQDYLDRKRLS